MIFKKKGQHLYFAIIGTRDLDSNPFFSCFRKCNEISATKACIFIGIFFSVNLLEMYFHLSSLGHCVPFCIRCMFIKSM